MPVEVSGYTCFPRSGGNISTADCLEVIYPADWPILFPGDETYGSLWLTTIQQWMQEIYWETPHATCEAVQLYYDSGGLFNYTWNEDGSDGTWCHETDEITVGETVVTRYWYPQRKWVEAEYNQPPSSPAYYYNDIKIGYYQFAELQDADLPETFPPRNIAVPPTIEAFDLASPAEEVTPWGIYIGECSCITGGGEFATEYLSEIP
jgi:hypothetical protein